MGGEIAAVTDVVNPDASAANEASNKCCNEAFDLARKQSAEGEKQSGGACASSGGGCSGGSCSQGDLQTALKNSPGLNVLRGLVGAIGRLFA